MRGAEHHAADALSRAPVTAVSSVSDDFPPASANESPISILAVLGVEEGDHVSRVQYPNVDQDDKFAEMVKTYLQHGIMPENHADFKKIQAMAKEYCIVEDKLYRKGCVKGRLVHQYYVPKKFRADIMTSYHDHNLGGHQGSLKTFNRIRSKFFWPGYHLDVDKYVESCVTCQEASMARPYANGPVSRMKVCYPFERVGIDVLGPLPVTSNGNRYIVMLVDHGSKWPEAFPVDKVNATVIANLLYSHVVCRYGAPCELLSDRGSNFLSRVVTKFCTLFDIKPVHTTAYHPQTNGLVERMNGTIVKTIVKMIDKAQDQWETFLPAALFAYRSTPHAELGISPFEILLGWKARLPIDVAMGVMDQQVAQGYQEHLDNLTTLRELARTHIEEVQASRNRNKDNAWPMYKSGDQVWLYTPKVKEGDVKKLTIKWNGPFTIIECRPPTNYKLRKNSDHDKTFHVHVSRLKPYVSRAEKPETLPEYPRMNEDEEEVASDDVNTPTIDDLLPDTLAEDLPYAEDSLQVSHENFTTEVGGLDPEKVSTVSTVTPADVSTESTSSGRPLYEIDYIMDMKWKKYKGRRTRYYLVHWKNNGPEHGSWEPYWSFNRCNYVLEDYHKQVEATQAITAGMSEASTSILLCPGEMSCTIHDCHDCMHL